MYPKLFQLIKKSSSPKDELEEDDKWIQKADLDKGSLRDKLGVKKGKKIPTSLYKQKYQTT